MTLEEAIQEFEDEAHHHSLHPTISDGAKAQALRAMRMARQEQPNKPLTIDDLYSFLGDAVWCTDTDGTAPGLVCLREGWDDYKKEPHIWLLDHEGNPGVYNMRAMMECGARFYHHKPEQEG